MPDDAGAAVVENKQRNGRNDPDCDALQEPDGNDRDQDAQNDRHVEPRELLEPLVDPVVEKGEADKHSQATEDELRQQRHHRRTDQQHDATDGCDDHPDQARVGLHLVLEHRHPHVVVADHAAAEGGDHVAQTGKLKLPVHIDVALKTGLERGDVEQDRDGADQHDGEDGAELPEEDGPVCSEHIGRGERLEQASPRERLE